MLVQQLGRDVVKAAKIALTGAFLGGQALVAGGLMWLYFA